MKQNMHLYEKIYRILYNKIDCGLLSDGDFLPSRSEMCREFGISEKTVRRVMEMLVQDGLIETKPGKRPIVVAEKRTEQKTGELFLQKAGSEITEDQLKTGILLCGPVIRHGISLCRGSDWEIPEKILTQMNPEQEVRFWKSYHCFWRFFAARNENELILQAIDRLGFSNLEPISGTMEIRFRCYLQLKEFIQFVKNGGTQKVIPFVQHSVLYRLSSGAETDPFFQKNFILSEKNLGKAKERYFRICMDILGLITAGYYQPGDKLPCHKELQRMYGVSIDTTMKAVKILKQWGVVTTKRGNGIFTAMDLEGLKKMNISQELIARHIRCYLDSLELLALTVEGVAAHVAACVTEEEVQNLYEKTESVYHFIPFYQRLPEVMLEFLTAHIHYQTLQKIYKLLQSNFQIGRSIPELVIQPIAGEDGDDSQYREAVRCLVNGNPCLFAEKLSNIFKNMHHLVVAGCKQHGYFEAVQKVYNGTLLWI